MQTKITIKFFLLIFILVLCKGLRSQNIDSINTVRFAAFLEESSLYEFAAEEYERLYFYFPNESTFFTKMLKNYRLSGNSNAISSRIKSKLIQSDTAVILYTLSLIDVNQYEEANKILTSYSNILPITIYNRLDLDMNLLRGNYQSALLKLNELNIQDSSYMSLIHTGLNLPQKSPIIAGIMSGIIPGLGRVYANDYKDGIVSFIFVITSGYQAYRRFKDDGIKSVSGWIYGGLTLGFYTGNIYGSIKSAKLFNQKKRDEHNLKAKKYIDLYYSNF